MAGSRRSTNRNRRDVRRRREQRGNENDGNSSDEENIEPIQHNGILAGLRQQYDLQRQIDALERDQSNLERDHAEEITQIRADCDNMVEAFQGILEPETDYETDALMYSETESDTSSSESSFLSDSSNLSSDEDSKENTENKDNKKKNKTKKQKGFHVGDYGELQKYMDQIYITKPDVPENEISPGLLCAGLCALPEGNLHWMRVLVQSYDKATSMVVVGALDYGHHWTIHKSLIKPLVKTMVAEETIPYRCAKQKETTEEKSAIGSIRKAEKQLSNESSKKKTKVEDVKENTASTSNKTGPEIKKNDLETTENNEPKPSTSGQKATDRDEELEPTKMFKKSLTQLQLQWCRKQPEFLQLKETIQTNNTISPETAEVYAFLEYTELLELDEKILREEKIHDIHKKVQKKKQKLKEKCNKRFHDRYEKLKNKEWIEIKMLDINRERELRTKYLQGEEDKKFTREEWKDNK